MTAHLGSSLGDSMWLTRRKIQELANSHVGCMLCRFTDILDDNVLMKFDLNFVLHVA